MSTKQLQIVTPIVTSVNGKSGAVTIDGLKNPNALTFTGGVADTYDGSEEKTIAIPKISVSNHTLIMSRT